jgi:putative peptidoglycan lipid II flippase
LAAGYAVHHAILFVDRALATTLATGSVASLNYAYRLALVIGQLSGLAVSTTAFPRMAEQAAAGDLPGQRATLESALRFVWLIGLPAAAGLIVLRVPLVQVVFQRGAFGQAATAAVSDLLIWYAPAVLADALCQPLWRALYAWRSTWSVVGVNGLQTVIRVLADVALIRSHGYNGLALSAALGLVVQLIVLGWLVRRRLGSYLSARWWREAIGAALAAIPALLMAACLTHLLSGAPAPLILVVAGLAGGLSYLLVLRLINTRWLRLK